MTLSFVRLTLPAKDLPHLGDSLHGKGSYIRVGQGSVLASKVTQISNVGTVWPG